MFDGVSKDHRASRGWDDEARAEDLLRLCRRFDPLLADPGTVLTPEAAGELRLLAQIHDLDERLPASLQWRALRPLIAPRLLLI